MQIQRAAETLEYDSQNLGKYEIEELIKSLDNLIQNIYLAAMHLAYLRDIDFNGVRASNMTDEQISITAERYNRGPDISYSYLKENPYDYGSRILENKAAIMEALR